MAELERTGGIGTRGAAIGIAVALVAAAGGACGSSHGPGGYGANPMSPTTASGSYRSNGERIYVTATSASGTTISYQGGPAGGFNMMMRLACANCHGTDGHGGSTFMFAQTIVAPDITWPALTGPDPDMDHPPYTEATVAQAITQGIDPGGHALGATMPRWSMSAADLNDLVGYLKTLK